MKISLLRELKRKNIISCYKDYKSDFNSVVVFNTEAILYFYKNKDYRDYFISSSSLLIDGVFLQLFCFFKGLPVNRYHGPDFMKDILFKNDCKKIIIGGSNSNKYFLKENLVDSFYPLPYSDDYSQLVYHFVSQYDFTTLNQKVIIFVSLGLLKQEVFTLLLFKYINIHYPSKSPFLSIIPIGAAADFLSGKKVRINKFFQLFGLEWFFRLLHEPRMIPRNFRSLKALLYFFLKG